MEGIWFNTESTNQEDQATQKPPAASSVGNGDGGSPWLYPNGDRL
jgi:hypothetical protein